MSHCIFQQAMASLAHFPMVLHPLVKTLRRVFLSFFFSNLSIKFIFFFYPMWKFFLSIILFIFFITQIIICYIFLIDYSLAALFRIYFCKNSIAVLLLSVDLFLFIVNILKSVSSELLLLYLFPPTT